VARWDPVPEPESREIDPPEHLDRLTLEDWVTIKGPHPTIGEIYVARTRYREARAAWAAENGVDLRTLPDGMHRRRGDR
jgi:hypothetical protein